MQIDGSDKLSAANANAVVGETFKVLRTAESGTVLRGVSFAPLGGRFLRSSDEK
jgi:hypothetical protein